MVGKKDAVSPHLVHVEMWHNDFSTLPMTRVAQCSVCGQHKFDLLEHGSRLATASVCGRDAVQIVPPRSFNMDFDLLRQTLGRLFTLDQNPYLLKFRADDHDVVVFHDGRAMVFGTSDPNAALSLYGKYIGG
jgi:adenylyltransferase/sulfurtransferase